MSRASSKHHGIRRGITSLLAALLLVSTTACQSMQDGARQVGVGARDLGNRMAAPFKKSRANPDFGNRTPAAAGDQDPFLPPPSKQEEEKATSMSLPPRPLNVVTLGNPTSLPTSNVRLASKPPIR